MVVKWPRFAFEKFPGADGALHTSMQSVGEAMAIGRTFKQAFVKAMRSRELDVAGDISGDLLERLGTPTHERYEVLFEAVRQGASEEDICRRTGIDPWFVAELAELARGHDPEAGLERSFKAVDTCAAEFAAETPYYYSGWERTATHEVRRGDRPAVAILGSGPNRIGQGIEFDYCCVHAAMTVRESGRDAVMINCNPETVSTDYDTSDRLYFEPLTLDDVLGVLELERPEGVIVQFGGQTPLKLARGLADAGVPLLGTPVDSIHLAEDRPSFSALLDELGLRSPPYATAGHDSVLEAAKKVGYPLLVRPSYVLGGRAMEICYSSDALEDYVRRVGASLPADSEIFLDRFLENAIEIDVDALCDGQEVRIGAVMQHVEEAGVHSGDSACVIPTMSLGPSMLEQVERATEAIALRLGVIGLINIQFAVFGDEELYVIEANPRASRTVPFVSKATGQPLAKLACRLMLGERLREMDLPPSRPPRHVSVKEAVLPFQRFLRSDSLLGPEMKSTGEVMGVAADYPAAFGKAQAAAGSELPTAGTVFISVTDGDKPAATQLAAGFHDLGFNVLATGGTAQAIRRMGVPVERIKKVFEGSPNVVDRIEVGRGGPGGEHPDGLRRPRRRLRDPPRRGGPGHPLHHHDVRSQRRPARHRRPAHRGGRGDLASGAARWRARALRPRPAGAQGGRRGPVSHAAGVAEPRTLAPPERRAAAVSGVEALGAYALIRAVDSGPAPAPRPGQFYMLSTPSGWGGGDGERPYLPRAFSYARARAVTGGIELSFLLEDVGPGTPGWPPSARVRRSRWWARSGIGWRPAAPSTRPVLVGGGIGTAPLLCLEDELPQPAPVLLGFRSAAHAEAAGLFAGEVGLTTDDGSAGRAGLVTDLLREELDREPAATVFACGPPAMLEAVRALCAERGVAAQLALESGMACGFGACYGCVVPTRDGYLRLCVDGPVLDAARLESALFPGAGH